MGFDDKSNNENERLISSEILKDVDKIQENISWPKLQVISFATTWKQALINWV